MDLQPSHQESNDEYVIVASSEGRAAVPLPAMAWLAEYLRGRDRKERLWFEHPRSHFRQCYPTETGKKKE